MQLTLSLILVSIGLVAAGNSAWKEGKEYQYKLQIYTKTNKETGTAAQACLSIEPQSDSLLNGKISNAIYGKTNEPFPGDGTDMSEMMQEFDEWKLNGQQFKIHLEDGMIRSLSVDSSLTSNEMNQLKAIVSQLQVNTKPENNLSSSDEDPTTENNVSYKVMEPTVFGNCETSYDISPFPNYLLRSHPALAHHKGVEDFIQIEKTRNLKNCMEHSLGKTNLNSSDEMNASSNPAARTRIVISGDLNEFTIQSVYATSPAMGFFEHMGITLESVKETKNFGEMLEDTNLMHEGIQLTKVHRSETFGLEIVGSCAPALDAEEQVTPTCWTGFVDPDAQCKNDFDAQWTSVGGAGCCGVFCLGQRQLCRKSFPGCVETVCYAAAQSAASACMGQFSGGEYPIPCGGSTNCAPGWRRVRCCPDQYA
ncbi:vitellogenin-1-like [Bradysia coprophila]|uniref:vitellogenin-1-like n=1 Tax=Bradysia coprophila TaxID=38358 RepID=UPI00187DBCA2|nr:vitellogenin-1-like [Bradysia coprophila]